MGVDPTVGAPLSRLSATGRQSAEPETSSALSGDFARLLGDGHAAHTAHADSAPANGRTGDPAVSASERDRTAGLEESGEKAATDVEMQTDAHDGERAQTVESSTDELVSLAEANSDVMDDTVADVVARRVAELAATGSTTTSEGRGGVFVNSETLEGQGYDGFKIDFGTAEALLQETPQIMDFLPRQISLSSLLRQIVEQHSVTGAVALDKVADPGAIQKRTSGRAQGQGSAEALSGTPQSGASEARPEAAPARMQHAPLPSASAAERLSEVRVAQATAAETSLQRGAERASVAVPLGDGGQLKLRLLGRRRRIEYAFEGRNGEPVDFGNAMRMLRETLSQHGVELAASATFGVTR